MIELMIVVAIIAILAAIAIPAYQSYTIRAQVTEGLSLSAGAKAAVWDFLSNKGRFPQSNESAGLAKSASITGNYVSGVDVSGGSIRIAFQGPEANAAIRDAELVLSPVTQTGSIVWSCGGTGSTIPAKYLPSSCRN